MRRSGTLAGSSSVPVSSQMSGRSFERYPFTKRTIDRSSHQTEGERAATLRKMRGYVRPARNATSPPRDDPPIAVVRAVR